MVSYAVGKNDVLGDNGSLHDLGRRTEEGMLSAVEHRNRTLEAQVMLK